MAFKGSIRRTKLWICRKTGVIPPNPAYFVWLCKHGSAKEIERAARNGAEVNAMFNGVISGLMYAIANRRNPDVVAAILEAGCDPNLKGASGETALMIACARNSGEGILRLLMQHGSDPEIKTDDGMTAADFARDSNNSAALAVFQEFSKEGGE